MNRHFRRGSLHARLLAIASLVLLAGGVLAARNAHSAEVRRIRPRSCARSTRTCRASRSSSSISTATSSSWRRRSSIRQAPRWRCSCRLNVGTFFALDSVTVKVDDKEVANYLYTEREVQALHRGGVQKLYLGNLKSGQHELVAFFTGKGPHDRDYRRGTSVTFDKTVGRQVRRTAHQRPRGFAAA